MFDEHFTLIIGVNGQGKSTLLHALRVAAGSYFLAIPDVTSRHIHPDEIRVENVGKQLIPQYPVKVEAVGTFYGKPETITWRRQFLSGSSSTTSKAADVGLIKKEAEQKYLTVIKYNKEPEGLPVIAFFGTSRVFGAGRNIRQKQKLGRQIFKDGYQDWEEMKSSKFQYEYWLASYDALLKLGREYDKTRAAFFTALCIANSYIKEVEFYNGELWLSIIIDGNKSDFLPLSMHSDGVRYYTAMVAEIAYRCIVLNGYLNEKAILESTGLVMIDEIDIHLHPNWQRHVVADLKKAFPKIQFAATTHSPFIVQSMDAGSLINLDKNELSISPDELPLNKVATEVMGVKNIRSDDFERRYEQARGELISMKKAKGDLTMDDYRKISESLSRIVTNETNDPINKAFLEAKGK